MITSAYGAASTSCSLPANRNTLVASVSRRNGRRISVNGSSFSISTIIRIDAVSKAGRRFGNATCSSPRPGRNPSTRPTSSNRAGMRAKPASTAWYPTAKNRTT